MSLTFEMIEAAQKRIADKVHRTEVRNSTSLNDATNADISLKCENFQKVGAFKARGACNAVFNLGDSEINRGVLTHSSGNHAQALAYAAGQRGVPAYIVMPSNAPTVKVNAVKGYGGQITFCEPTNTARSETAARMQSETGAMFIHPFDNYSVMAGQGTAVLELLEEKPELEVLVVPIGGGGLISGSAVAAKTIKPTIHIVGVEPLGASDCALSLKNGVITPLEHPTSIADGLLSTVGELTFPIIQEKVDEVLTVTEDEISWALKFVLERLKIVIEPSAAVTIAALLSGKLDVQGKQVGVILSGGNVMLERISAST